MNDKLQGPADRFRADPTDRIAFETLEEQLFLDAEWQQLVALYEARLSAKDMVANTQSAGQLRFRMAQILVERCGDLDAAEESLKDALRLIPGFRPAMTQLRGIHLQKREWDAALQLGEAEAELNLPPEIHAALCVELGDLWQQQKNDADRALAFYEKALASDSNCAGARLGISGVLGVLGQHPEAAEELALAVENLAGAPRADALSRLADLYRGPLGDLEKAEATLKRALADDPQCDSALAGLCEVKIQQQDWTGATELMEQRFALADGAARRSAIAEEAGRIQLEIQRDPQAARLWYERVRELYPERPQSHANLARIEQLAGNRETELEHWSRAIESDHDGELDASQRGRFAELVEAQDPRRAAEVLRVALAADPGNDVLVGQLAGALGRTGQFDELASILEQQAADAADRPIAQAALLTQLGALHEDELCDTEAAEEVYQRAFRTDPSSSRAALALERIHRKASAWDKLRAHLEQVGEFATGKRRVDAQIGLGELLLDQLDDPEAAKLAFDNALAEEGTAERALRGLERVGAATGDEDAVLESFEREAGITTDRERLGFLVWEIVRILEGRDQSEEALLWIERLIAISPEDRDGLEARARLQQQLGYDTELLETLERLDVLLSGPEQARNRRILAELHKKSGQLDQAIHAYQGALAADPEDVSSLSELLELLNGSERWEELSRVRRELAEHLTGEERRACLLDLSELLDRRLERADAAISVLEELVRDGSPDSEIEQRLEGLLERSARYEELEQRLALRRDRESVGSPDARALDRRRAVLLLDNLARPADAAALLNELSEHCDDDSEVTLLLERALREASDPDGLCDVLALRAEHCDDDDERDRLDFERAELLVSPLARPEEARQTYERVAARGGSLATEADLQIDALAEREGDWELLRDRLEGRLANGTDDDASVHDRLVSVYRDRLRDRAGAFRHLEAAVAIDPTAANRWQALARLCEEDDRHEDHLKAVLGELAATNDSERELVLRLRAAQLCRGELGDAPQAGEHYRRVLELDPSDATAAEFLVEELEKNQDHEGLVELLGHRLEAVQRESGPAETEASLRLRIASLWAGPLNDPHTAISVLATAVQDDALLLVTAEPLADLYHRTGQRAALAELCRKAATASDHAGERANWTLRLAETLRAEGQEQYAAEAYRQVLADRPGDRVAQSALRDLYRQLGEAEPLSHLLEAELSSLGGPDEIPVRLELATLLESSLQRPEDALVHLKRVLQLDREHATALDRSLALTKQLGESEERLSLLDRAIDQTRSPIQRAQRLAERGELLAEDLDRLTDAASSYEEAIAADPFDASRNATLREILERAGDWTGVLRCIEREATTRPLAERGEFYERAAEIAETHLEAEDALQWLERLRTTKPDDASVLARIADLHRRAGSHEALLWAREAELRLDPTPERRCEIELERAQLYEEQLEAPGRAINALESAREADPRGREVLRRLARLYESSGRKEDHAEVLESLIEGASEGERLSLRKNVADLFSGSLANPERAIDHLWAALTEHRGSQVERIEILGHLAAMFRAIGRSDLWARVAEEELRSLDADEPVFAERRSGLHRDLARSYSRELNQVDRALPHWRALLECPREGEGAPATEVIEEAESELLRGLRTMRDHVELEWRLAERLESQPDDEKGWLELGRLRAELLHRPSSAAEAFRRVLELDAESLPAIRGLRTATQRLGDWESAANTLEMELDLDLERAPNQRSALLRRLGEICWHQLDSTTRASRAFAAALEAEPTDLRALRALQDLCEAMEDWRGLLDFFDSEVEILGEESPERRQEVLLRAGALSAEKLEDTDRALRSYEQASEIAEVPLEPRRAWALLYERTECPERFCEVFSSWCDDPDANPDAGDHLRLAVAYEQIEELGSAVERALAATDLDASYGEAWDTLARLREARGELGEAAVALEKAADRMAGPEASTKIHHAAVLVRDSDPERALALYQRSLASDPARPETLAEVATLAAGLDRHELALEKAKSALDLAGSRLDPEQRLITALAGAAAARALEDLGSAARLYASALEIEPEHPEALSAQSEVLYELGDFPKAGKLLEARLALEIADPKRSLHLSMLGDCFEKEGRQNEALQRYREALILEPELDDAQAGTIRLLENAGKIEEAVNALQEWAARAQLPDRRAARLLRAAELQFDPLGREDLAETLLREAVASDPSLGHAWVLLANTLWRQQRGPEALAISTEGLELAPDALHRAELAVIRAESLEAAGERGAAADAYRVAIACDPSRSDAALAGAKLLRALGEWRSAATVLREFVANHPREDRVGVAPVLTQLGRLLAGPLESIDEAIDVYRQALDCDGDQAGTREALAELLALRPDLWEEALGRHRELLEHNPARVGSIRALVAIARARKKERMVNSGLCILRSLGVATPEELDEAPGEWLPDLPDSTGFVDRTWEAARRLAAEVSQEIGDALEVGLPDLNSPADASPRLRFRAAVTAAEAELTAPALVPLTTEELASVLKLTAQITLEDEDISGDGHLLNSLTRQLGRRVRRRLRRILEGFTSEDISQIDFESWRGELRGLASTTALRKTGVPLRDALSAWLVHDEDHPERTLPPQASFEELVLASPEARAFLRRIVGNWAQGL